LEGRRRTIAEAELMRRVNDEVQMTKLAPDI
jgi:hypothetical protein